MRKSLSYLILIISLLCTGALTYIFIYTILGNSVETKQIAVVETVKEVNAAKVETNEVGSLIGNWNNEEDTQLTLNEDGTFEADHYTVSSEINGTYTVKGEEIVFQYKNKKWKGKVSKDSEGNTVMNVNLYDEKTTLTKVGK